MFTCAKTQDLTESQPAKSSARMHVFYTELPAALYRICILYCKQSSQIDTNKAYLLTYRAKTEKLGPS